jgi:hypothetical protein
VVFNTVKGNVISDTEAVISGDFGNYSEEVASKGMKWPFAPRLPHRKRLLRPNFQDTLTFRQLANYFEVN